MRQLWRAALIGLLACLAVAGCAPQGGSANQERHRGFYGGAYIGGSSGESGGGGAGM